MIKLLKSFKKRDDGVAAIEFAIFAIPFFLLIMGILELGIMFGAATLLNGAAEDAAREIRTGQVKDPDGTLACGTAEECFSKKLCEKTFALVDCTQIRYHVIKLDDNDTFVDALSDTSIMSSIYDASDPSGLAAASFDDSDANDRVIVRIAYDYQLLTPLSSLLTQLAGSAQSGFSNRPGNKRLLISTVVLQNEPYN